MKNAHDGMEARLTALLRTILLRKTEIVVKPVRVVTVFRQAARRPLKTRVGTARLNNIPGGGGPPPSKTLTILTFIGGRAATRAVFQRAARVDATRHRLVIALTGTLERFRKNCSRGVLSPRVIRPARFGAAPAGTRRRSAPGMAGLMTLCTNRAGPRHGQGRRAALQGFVQDRGDFGGAGGGEAAGEVFADVGGGLVVLRGEGGEEGVVLGEELLAGGAVGE